jgi:hypothetical protein
MDRFKIQFLILFVVALALGCQKRPQPAVAQPSTGAVTIEILRGEAHIDSIEIENVATGTSLESLMRSIDDPPITIHGSGVTAFVHGIGDLATSGSDGWTFKVDGKFANQGIGSTTLTPPTTIRWSYVDASEIVSE